MSKKVMPSAVREGKPGSSMFPESSLGKNSVTISIFRKRSQVVFERFDTRSLAL